MKKIFLIICLVFTTVSIKAQNFRIYGPTEVEPNSITTYTASSGYPYFTDFVVSFHVIFLPAGATVMPSSSDKMKINWGSTYGYGYISCVMNSGKQFSLMIIVVAGKISLNSIYGNNIVYINTAPSAPLVLENKPTNTTKIQWQKATVLVNLNKSSIGQDDWIFDDIPGANATTYQPPILQTNTNYRCLITINGSTVVNSKSLLISLYYPLPLNAGFLSLASPCNYNSNPIVTTTNAQGGLSYVSPYIYSWQISYNNLNWTTIASTQALPNNLITNVKEQIWLRRIVSCGAVEAISNILAINPVYVSPNAENLNYVREINVLIPNIKYWQDADLLTIGDKLQTTTYLDGLGRPIEKVSRETATPPASAPANSLWGDIVQVPTYDEFGRQSTQLLPFTTTTASGFYKNKTITNAEQINYYNLKFNEGAWAKATATFDNSPLNRIVNQKSPGQSWQNSAGNTAQYQFNNLADEVQMLQVNNANGSLPFSLGIYAANKLFKSIVTDVNGKEVIEFTNNSGQVVLKKVQLDNIVPVHRVPNANQGWICTYNIYDDYGQLRFQIQPEGVAFFDQHKKSDGITWSFDYSGEGNLVLNEQSFQYQYDQKGRTIYKKSPGAQPLFMIYDIRDRIVFMQDGNQRAITPAAQWTANVYDELDRPTITTLYNTNKTIAQLQADIDAASGNTTTTITQVGNSINSLTISNRATQPPTPSTPLAEYVAQNTIEFIATATNNYETNASDNFVAHINATATSPATTITTTTYNNPLNLNSANVIPIKFMYYDNYAFANAQPFNTNFTNTDAYANSSNVMPIAPTTQTTSFATGNSIRVLGTNTFITTTLYFDNDGQPIQSIENNILNGQDITTLQYSWDAKLLSTHTQHTTQNTGMANYSILSKHFFDKIGRTTALLKKFGDATSNFKAIANYFYDDIGNLQTKVLDPEFYNPTNGKKGLETLDYSYNIHNQLTGINKDYALKTPTKYKKWDNYFGLYLGYDNQDNQFAQPNLMGQLTGVQWTTQGDDAQRKYDYLYDNVGRLVKANFTQKDVNDNSFTNTQLDYSVLGNGSNNTIQYDHNGNLISMIQKGVVAGNNTPVAIDNLSYFYKKYSNQLIKVTDANTLPSNGKFGDFKDGTNNSSTNEKGLAFVGELEFRLPITEAQ
jgi:Domain of unknown function (DUF6443)